MSPATWSEIATVKRDFCHTRRDSRRWPRLAQHAAALNAKTQPKPGLVRRERPPCVASWICSTRSRLRYAHCRCCRSCTFPVWSARRAITAGSRSCTTRWRWCGAGCARTEGGSLPSWAGPPFFSKLKSAALTVTINRIRKDHTTYYCNHHRIIPFRSKHPIF